MQFGPEFRGLSRLFLGPREAVGELYLASARSGPYRVPPPMLDSALQSLMVLAIEEIAAPREEPGTGFLLAMVRSLRVKGPLGERGHCHAVLESVDAGGTFRGNVRLYGPSGAIAVEVDGLVLRPAGKGIAEAAWARERIYSVQWEERAAIAAFEPAPASARAPSNTLAAPASPPRARPWLWVVPDGAEASALAAHLSAQGQRDVVVAWAPGERPRAVANAPEPLPIWETLLDLANAERAVYLAAPIPPEGVAPELDRLLELVRGAARCLRAASRLTVATFAAHAPAPDPAQAALWGLMRVMAREHPDRWGGLVDLPIGLRSAPDRLAAAVAAAPDAEAAVRPDGAVLEPALRREPLPPPAGRDPIRADATYLLTGGLGGLGLPLASWLVDRGARHLLLMGRRAPSPQAAESIAALERRGAKVRALQGDAASRSDVERAVASPSALGWPALAGVFHLAAALADGVMERLDREKVRTAVAPKVDGAWNLHRATQGLALDHFVLFSSIASFGTPGQAAYAAANAFVDALARRRRADGLPALSVGLGAVADVGGLAQLEARGGRGAPGVESMPPDKALDALGALLASPSAHVLLASVAWPAFTEGLPAGASRLYAPLLERARAAASAADQPPAAAEDFAAQVRAMPPRPRREAVESHLKQQITGILGLSLSQAPAPDLPLMKAGLDSLMTVKLRNALKASLKLELPVTLLFDYTTISALADHLTTQLGGGVTPAPAPAPAPAPLQPEQEDPLDALLSELESMPEEAVVTGLREDKPKA